MDGIRIGVLALQGAFAEHVAMLRQVGATPVEVRLPADLADVGGLILPGGESTTMRRLIERWGLRQPILDLAHAGAPLFGTCAGMILLADEITDGDAPVLPLLDVAVKRNAFGRQLDSFETDLVVPVLGDRSRPRHLHPGAGPRTRRAGGRRPGEPARRPRRGRAAGSCPGHRLPSRAGRRTRFHRLLTTMAEAYREPAEGAGRRHHPLRRTAGHT